MLYTVFGAKEEHLKFCSQLWSVMLKTGQGRNLLYLSLKEINQINRLIQTTVFQRDFPWELLHKWDIVKRERNKLFNDTRFDGNDRVTAKIMSTKHKVQSFF